MNKNKNKKMFSAPTKKSKVLLKISRGINSWTAKKQSTVGALKRTASINDFGEVAKKRQRSTD